LESGDSGGAVAAFRRALELQPNFPDAMSNLSVALCRQGNFADAVVVARLVLAQRTRSPEAVWNLAQALRGMGDTHFSKAEFPQAIQYYRQAINLNFQNFEAHVGMGEAYAALRDARAEEEYRHALQIKPKATEVTMAMAQWLDQTQRREEAVEWLERTLALDPNHAAAHVNLAAIYGEWGRLTEALPLARRALELDPTDVNAATTLGALLSMSGLHDEAAEVLHGVLKDQTLSEDESPKAIAARKNLGIAMNNLLMLRHYKEDFDPEVVLEEHREFGRRFDRPRTDAPEVDLTPGRKLRIGYVSGDFRAHSVAFFIQPVIEHHDPEAVEVYLYSTSTFRDPIGAAFRKHPNYRTIDAVPDREAFTMIRQDRIDILVDLSGHTGHSRLPLFGMKPAPVQATYLGYPNTTGMTTIDFRITDRYADPPGETEAFHTEKLWRLPHTAWCYRPYHAAPEVGALPCEKLGKITFGCFNTSRKISSATARMWADLLAALPEARLVLKTREYSDEATRQRVMELLTSNDVPQDRVEIRLRQQDMTEHLATYQDIDIALDPYPYHGTTTTCDSLYMGVPVVTLAGRTHVSRVGVSLLSNVGLTELIATSPQDYVAIAAKLAGNEARLTELRHSLRERIASSPICDEVGFTRELERAYRGMWEETIVRP
ncbi:MAG TPA: tetratricopeptide repeat protein, partial [Tepidisphaeraceae bacterium]